MQKRLVRGRDPRTTDWPRVRQTRKAEGRASGFMVPKPAPSPPPGRRPTARGSGPSHRGLLAWWPGHSRIRAGIVCAGVTAPPPPSPRAQGERTMDEARDTGNAALEPAAAGEPARGLARGDRVHAFATPAITVTWSRAGRTREIGRAQV